MGNGNQSAKGSEAVAMSERIYLMESTGKTHTTQLTQLTSDIKDLQISNAKITTMQENSSSEVKEIDRQHEVFVETQRLRFDQTDEAIKDLTKMVNNNNVTLAEDAGRNAERHRLTTIILSVLIILTAALSTSAQIFFK